MAIVWVVDDDIALIEMVRSALQPQGHSVRPFGSAKVALEALASAECEIPGVIVTDLMMPEMDGYTFHLELQKADRTRGIPLVVMTAKGRTRDLFAQSPNVWRFIEKPFDLDKMREAVRSALAGG